MVEGGCGFYFFFYCLCWILTVKFVVFFLNFLCLLLGDAYVRGMLQVEVDIYECVYDLVANVCTELADRGESSVVEVSDDDCGDEIAQLIEGFYSQDCMIYFYVSVIPLLGVRLKVLLVWFVGEHFFFRICFFGRAMFFAEERIEYPPCIRLMDTSGNNELHIITISGASIGFSPQCDICLKNSPETAGLSTQVLTDFCLPVRCSCCGCVFSWRLSFEFIVCLEGVGGGLAYHVS